jgi:hypothetical protein
VDIYGKNRLNTFKLNKISGKRDGKTTDEYFGWSGKLSGEEVNHGYDKKNLKIGMDGDT